MKLAAALLLAVIVVESSKFAEALSIVNAEATLDWTGFTFTTTGTLAARRIESPQVHASTPTSTTLTTTTGSVTTDASAVNGFLAANAAAQTIADGGVPHVGEASAFVNETFWFHGTGTGALVVTIPYHLAVTIETDERDLTRAAARVSFDIGPGVSGPDFMDADAITLDGGGLISRDGILTASREFSNPTFGPLVSLSGAAHVSASSALPEETDSILLLTLGLLVVGAELAWRWRRDSRALTSRR